MPRLFARIGRFEAPVDYREIYPWLQRVRAAAALVVLIASIAGGYLGVSGALFPMAVAATVAVHAIWRSRVPHPPAEILVIDAVAIVLGLGVTDYSSAGLVAGLAYIIAAAITFGGLKPLALGLLAFAGAASVRPFLPIPTPADLNSASDGLLWTTVAVFLIGVALSLTAAATEVYKAKRAQGAALRAERRASEMKNEFVSMITHELRTPLTNIAGFAATLLDTWKSIPSGDVDEFLEIIVSESDHLHHLVEDVLTIPRLEAGRLLLDTTDFALRSTVFKVVDLLLPGSSGRSASVSVGSDVTVHADPNRVEQVLRNLVENARKYGGNTISIDAMPRGEHWQIVVADNGTGIPKAAADRVFNAFEQVSTGDARSDSGFGIGLTVARHLVEAMRGRIWYEPGFPVGARFCFTLPRAQTEAVDKRHVA